MFPYKCWGPEAWWDKLGSLKKRWGKSGATSDSFLYLIDQDLDTFQTKQKRVQMASK